MKRDAKNANRSKKRRKVRQKKSGVMGHITCHWQQEEHIRFQRNVLDIPFLKKEQYIVATFSPHFANQFILLRKMIPGSRIKDLKRKMIGISNPLGTSGGSYLVFDPKAHW